MKLSRILALSLSLFATAAVAQTKGTPTLQTDKSGATRCLYLQDLNNPSATDKSVPFGCLDAKGAWNLPAALRNVQDIDETVLRGFGYVADGASHPLSGVTSLNGRNTSGWTLGQWQAVLPAAQALSDEIDGAVINSVVQAASGPIRIRVGPGAAKFSRPIVSCANSVAIYGAGMARTVFSFASGVSGWEHCKTPATKTNTRIELVDINFAAANTGGSTYGLNLSFVPDKNLVLRNVQLDKFNSCILTQNAAGSILDHVFCGAGYATPALAAASTVGTGIEMRGEGTFVTKVMNTLVGGYKVGYDLFASSTPYTGFEDIALINSAAGDVQKCIVIRNADTNASPLLYKVENFSCNSFSGFVDAQQVWGLTISGGNWLVEDPARSGNVWTGSGRDFFNFGRAIGVTLRDAYISNNAITMSISSYVRMNDAAAGYGGAASNITVTNNTFEYHNLTLTNGMVWKGYDVVGAKVFGNQFVDSFSVQATPPASAYKWVDNATNTDSLVYATPGRIITFTGSSVAHTSAVATNDASASLPPGMWSCSVNSLLQPAGGASASLIQAGFNTTSVALPTAPGNGYFSITGTFTGGITYNYGPWVFDFTTATTNTTVYSVGLVSYTGGTLAVSSAGQCVRLR